MLAPAVRAALLDQARQERRARSPHAPYLESELQAYVERNFVDHLADWFGLAGKSPSLPVRLLGAQVPCAAGLIDLLATIGEQLVIVELKAQPVSERTVGQVMRYKAAVENLLTRQLWRLLQTHNLPVSVAEAEVHAMCMVIGPSFDPYAAGTLRELGWSLVAERTGDGLFTVREYAGGYSGQRAEPALELLTKAFVDGQLAYWLAQCLASESNPAVGEQL